ncbi:hypothetical protein LEMLEM_LOCUS18011, partial [Lemmus lemmus]
MCCFYWLMNKELAWPIGGRWSWREAMEPLPGIDAGNFTRAKLARWPGNNKQTLPTHIHSGILFIW